VNRLWTNHFGNGLVRSADNFGFNGDKPTHPDLLDWLASEVTSDERKVTRSDTSRSLVTRYSSLKRIHRLMVTSATYRQASLHPNQEDYALRDAGNHLLWRAERRRLESESLRDRMLFVGDDLDTRMTGPGFKPTIQAEALEGLSRKGDAWKPSPLAEQRRRAVYMFSQRSLLPPLMTTFDFVETTLPCVQRSVSTVAPQALAMMNNAFAHERSEALAQRLVREIPVPAYPRPPSGRPVALTPIDVVGLRIRRLWQITLARDPQPSEEFAARSHIESQQGHFAKSMEKHNKDPGFLALASLCHVLLNTNEFVYVD
jgi:hypothetical protein